MKDDILDKDQIIDYLDDDNTLAKKIIDFLISFSLIIFIVISVPFFLILFDIETTLIIGFFIAICTIINRLLIMLTVLLIWVFINVFFQKKTEKLKFYFFKNQSLFWFFSVFLAYPFISFLVYKYQFKPSIIITLIGIITGIVIYIVSKKRKWNIIFSNRL